MTPPQLRVNIFLSHLLAKGFPEQVRAARLRHKGNMLCKEGQLQAALEKYDQALRLEYKKAQIDQLDRGLLRRKMKS